MEGNEIVWDSKDMRWDVNLWDSKSMKWIDEMHELKALSWRKMEFNSQM